MPVAIPDLWPDAELDRLYDEYRGAAYQRQLRFSDIAHLLPESIVQRNGRAYPVLRRHADADAARLLALVRAHSHLENRLHDVRDVTLGEDACGVRTGSSPEVLAALRNAVVHLLESGPKPNKAAAARRMAATPEEAVRLILA